MAIDKSKQHDDTSAEEIDMAFFESEGTMSENEGAPLDLTAGDEPGDEPKHGLQDDLSSQLREQQDRALRLQAEMQNLRQRTSREINDERRYGAMPVLRDLMPVVDNIDRAIDAADKDGDAETLLEGFRLVRQQLMGLLTQHQCQKIEAEGQPFDPEQHEAILQQPSDLPDGTVVMVTQSGYRLHDRVVRAPQVIVSSGPSTDDQT